MLLSTFWKLERFFIVSVCLALLSGTLKATGFDGKLDRFESNIAPDHPTVLHGSLHNGTTTQIFVTGIQIKVSDNASAELYNGAFLEQILSRLEPHQTWEGPLLTVTPGHTGPLAIIGFLVLKGGASARSTDLLLSIPFELQIEDPKRERDGSFDPGNIPTCDRSLEACCDPDEALCIQVGDRCFYVARGFGHQQICVNHKSQKLYDRIFDLKVSTDGSHAAAIVGSPCSTGGVDEMCKRLLVYDGKELPTLGQPIQLLLSADGRHYVYLSRENCLMHEGSQTCSGWAEVVVDGKAGAHVESIRNLSLVPEQHSFTYDVGKRCRYEVVSETTSIPGMTCKEWTPIEIKNAF